MRSNRGIELQYIDLDEIWSIFRFIDSVTYQKTYNTITTTNPNTYYFSFRGKAKIKIEDKKITYNVSRFTVRFVNEELIKTIENSVNQEFENMEIVVEE